ncbi:dockerin type I domain-containing protein [Roseinatronobacter alkalisoli]
MLQAAASGRWEQYEALAPIFNIPEGYVVDRVFTEPGRTVAQDGFLGIGLVSDNGDPMLVMRGTTGTLDWVDNLNSAGVGYRQVDVVWDDLLAWMNDLSAAGGTPLPLHITGHSQAGAQAQVIAARAAANGIYVDQVVTFNAPALPTAALAYDVGSNIGRVSHYVSVGDIVSLVGSGYLQGGVTLYRIETDDIQEVSLRNVSQLRSALTGLAAYVEDVHTGHWTTSVLGPTTAIQFPGMPSDDASRPSFTYFDPQFRSFVEQVDYIFDVAPILIATYFDLRAWNKTSNFMKRRALHREGYTDEEIDEMANQLLQYSEDARALRLRAAELDFQTRAGWDEGARFLGELASFQLFADSILPNDGDPLANLTGTEVIVARSGEELVNETGHSVIMIAAETGSTLSSMVGESAFLLGPSPDHIVMGGGGNTVLGGAQDLDGDIITGFGTTDLIIAQGAAFDAGAMGIVAGSAILSVDLPAEEPQSFVIRLEGDYSLDAFGVLPAPGGTAIFYEAPPPEMLFQVEAKVAAASGNALDGVSINLERSFGNFSVAQSNEDGEFSFDMLIGTGGRLTATREYDPVNEGNVTALDALNVLRLAVGLSPSWGTASPMDFIAADINQDGQVTALDALEVLRAAVGLQSANQPRWFFMDSDADLSHIDRNDTRVEEGIRFDPAVTDTSNLSMTGVLLGNMQEYAQ